MVLGENGMGNYYLDCCIVNLVLCDELDDNLSDDNEWMNPDKINGNIFYIIFQFMYWNIV